MPKGIKNENEPLTSLTENMKEDVKENIPAWAKELFEENKKLREKVEMFEDLAGKNTIASYKDGQRDFSARTVHFRVYNGKIVIGWSDLDMSKFNPYARDGVGENINVELKYLDGATEKVNVVMFERSKERLKVELVESNNSLSIVAFPPNIVREYKLERKEMTIPTKYLNR